MHLRRRLPQIVKCKPAPEFPTSEVPTRTQVHVTAGIQQFESGMVRLESTGELMRKGHFLRQLVRQHRCQYASGHLAGSTRKACRSQIVRLRDALGPHNRGVNTEMAIRSGPFPPMAHGFLCYVGGGSGTGIQPSRGSSRQPTVSESIARECDRPICRIAGRSPAPRGRSGSVAPDRLRRVD
jgi:hypothetical protein